MFSELFTLSQRLVQKARQQPFHRFLYDSIDFNARLIGIVGARGAGKTTLALQYLATLPIGKGLYVSCDHPLVAAADLFELAQQAEQEGFECLIIDEIHKKSNFAPALKNIYDFLSLKIIFTGSSAAHLHHAKTDLSRRALIYQLPELSFREYLALKTGHTFPSWPLPQLLEQHEQIALEITAQIKLLPHFRAYLNTGAYPYFMEGEDSYIQRLAEVVRLTLREDLSAVYGVEADKIEALYKLLQVLCASKPFQINYERIAAATGLARNTLKKYLYYLEDLSLLRRIGGKVRGDSYIAKPDKLYLHNPNLFQILCPEPNPGSQRESFFAMMSQHTHHLAHPPKGDFLIDNTWLVEIGGANKDRRQIHDQPHAFIAADKLELGYRKTIPLWLFGFLY